MNTYDIDVRVSYRVKKTVTEKDEDTAMAVACDEPSTSCETGSITCTRRTRTYTSAR